jgi:hypothetical protein
MRMAKGPEGGSVTVRLDGTEISTIETNQTNWSVDWVQLPLKHMVQGQHLIEVTNGFGLNAVNVIALLSQEQYRSSRQTLIDMLSTKHVYIIGEQNLIMLDPRTGATQSISQFEIPAPTASVTYEMKGQGRYTATIESTKQAFLVLTEYYNPTFDATSSVLHFPAQYVMNGYVVEPNSNMTVELQYRATSLVENSRIVSLSVGIVLIVASVVSTLKAKRPKPPTSER